MASKTLVILTIVLLVLSLLALGIALMKPLAPSTSTAEGKVMAYVNGPAATPAQPMTTTGIVAVNVVNKT